MAQRFGGKYSPDDAPDISGAPQKSPFHGQRRSRVGGRVNFLFLAPLPLAFRAFFQDPTGLALNLLAFGTLILAAWLTRDGLLAQEAYEARKIARRPAIPRKMFGSALTGIGLFITGYAGTGSIASPMLLAIVGTLLHGFSFGIDPLRDKGMEGIDTFQSDRVARVIEGAEKHLAAMSDAIKRAGDRELEARVAQFQATARDMFRTVEEDPRDLTAARKYLGVYLLGARDATAKFADIYARSSDMKARADYEALLTDLEENFAARTRALLLDDRSDLDVEIEVLRERLAREGIRA
ncbi:5-bromo-4-chloroindolyl phosphate hydrolysis family protein [Pseudohalocynthiibacter aestuariivivens]|uniref:5-bromo-4-chloroindolyl phosphate hydrolysis family protein n=1 Tax=Pseudohalocynthiibacter aestuariivivens TaxID=1591409 RepID=A0ABV5JBD8_9RHOB|nr:5-bromo-4-chloroindolyl phosphate hydrolysis family protein [Pseudohalocynthiibacter aestuariivivens]MCK0101312.1 5-bromo-4-chloroindolyl phosphate hydrolysis family protein [Pseudohalocynthiibacter sp. F2068]